MADTFFEEKQPAALLKHAVLQRYVRTYFSKVGSGVYLDGYAGPGTYDDAEPGSPVVAVKSLEPLAHNRNVELMLVEKKAATFAELERLCSQPGFERATALRGTVEDHLDTVLDRAVGRPLLAFLDPFGMGLPLTILHRLLDRASGGQRRVPTEVLLNFSRPGLYRNAGKLTGTPTSDHVRRALESTVRRMDGYLGGQWWQELWQTDRADFVDEVLARYKKRLPPTGWRVFDVPVAPNWESAPLYHLLLVTSSQDGIWLFNNNVSSALEEYYHWSHRHQPSLQSYADCEEGWVATLRQNIEQLLADRAISFVIIESFNEVFGTALGYAREKHLRKALQELHRDGIVADEPKGPLMRFQVRPTGAGQSRLI